MVLLYIRLPKGSAKIDMIIAHLEDDNCLLEAEVIIKSLKPVYASLTPLYTSRGGSSYFNNWFYHTN